MATRIPSGVVYSVHIWLFIVFTFPLLVCGQGRKESLRVAVFNIKELSTNILTDVDEHGAGQSPQAIAAASIIRRIRPDVLLVQEIDHDYESMKQAGEGIEKNAQRFLRAYLSQGKDGIDYPFLFVAPCNTGILTGLDLNRDGSVAGRKDRGARTHGEDSFGFGTYPGQYAMALFSKYPIATQRARTFQKFLWKDLPGHHMPVDYYSAEATAILRLSSKSHWDVPIEFAGKTIHLLISHPTPPVFDGEEDRNGRRNFDEIKFWVHYVDGDSSLYDDQGKFGGLDRDQEFIIMGDLNASLTSESRYDNRVAIEQLLEHPRIQDPGPLLTSEGAHQDRTPGPPNYEERSTARFGRDFRVRVDYLLPSTGLHVIRGGVFWPSAEKDPEGYKLAEKASDHRLVWIDIRP